MVRLMLNTISEGIAAEAYVSFPPGLLSFCRFWNGLHIEKGMYYEI